MHGHDQPFSLAHQTKLRQVCLGTVIFVIINPYAFTGLQVGVQALPPSHLSLYGFLSTAARPPMAASSRFNKQYICSRFNKQYICSRFEPSLGGVCIASARGAATYP